VFLRNALQETNTEFLLVIIKFSSLQGIPGIIHRNYFTILNERPVLIKYSVFIMQQ